MTTRPLIMARRGVVSSGHYLATEAGLRILRQGGNAIDAAAAMGLCLTLVEPQQCGMGGEAPTLVYAAQEGKTYAVSGMGWSPAAFTIDWCRENDIDLIPGDGYLPACVPAPLDTWATAVARWGTMSLAQVLQPSIELARDGYPVYHGLRRCLVANEGKFRDLYPSTGAIFLREGRAPQVGDVLRNADWANTMEIICRAERAAQARGRVAGIEAGRDAFYRGEIAERIAAFIRDNPVPDQSGKTHAGLLTFEDMAEWHATVEEPVTVNYRGLDVFKCPSWTQGPVFLQQLTLLEGYDLAAMGHNSPAYLHLLIEVAKLAFADREAYYGDPSLDDIPFDVLLSKAYADGRRGLIGAEASGQMRPGDVGRGFPEYAVRGVLEDNRLALASMAGGQPTATGREHVNDTTHLDAIDRAGNMVAATPSGGWIPSSPVIAGLGFPLGTRGQMFYLNARRPNALAPHKRPRATLTPTIVTRDGKPMLAFGTEGGDAQDQTSLQFLLNVVEFGMNVQQALDAPVVHSLHFPSSFYPRQGYPQRVAVEEGISEQVVQALVERGHEVIRVKPQELGKGMGIWYDAEREVIMGGAAPKSNNVGYALGW